MNGEPTAASGDSLFLPDFCAIRTVFAVVVTGELLAFVLVLTSPAPEPWSELALVSLFVQWVGLASAALLCVSRRWLRLLANPAAGVVSYLLVLAVTLAVSEAAFRLVEQRLVEVQLGAVRHWDYLLRNLGVSAVVSFVALRYFYVQYQWKANLESEASARIQALHSRIRPHFLFNSMNTIASLTRSRPALAEQVVEDLADLFRVSLGDARVPATLARELELCRQYLRIEALRLGERLTVRWAVEDLPGDARLPALLLQPLVENAIYHGIEPAPGGGALDIEGRREGARIRIEIGNTVPPGGADAHRSGNRMAQDNVRQRLGAFFEGRADMEASRAGDRYVVVLRFPYRREAP